MADPIKRELLNNALVSVADNLLVMVTRTARSPNVKNSMDFSAAICDADGRLVAQGLAIPVHLGSMEPALAGCMAHFGKDIRPGDVLATNDPYSGGSHLNDIFTFQPVHVEGRRVAFVGLVLHHSDLGGRVAGGNAADSHEIFEEGLRIPPVRIVEAGQPNETMLRVIEWNTRVPERVVGDVRAQLASLAQAAVEIERLATAWGAESFVDHVADLLAYAERLTRANLAEMPDGEAEFTEWNDDDGAGTGPIRLHVKLIKRGDEMIVDFSDTQDDTGGATHCNRAFTASCAYAGIRTVLRPEIPNNSGFYAAVKVITRPGTFVDVRFPAALGSRGQVGYRLRSIMMGVLARLFPGTLPACAGGSEFAIAAAGTDEEGRRFLHLEFHNTTGNGGGPVMDGQEAGPYCIGNLANVPVEMVEAEYPIRIEEYAFRPDSGGAGQFRGALGISRQYRFLVDNVTVQVRSDRFQTDPWGIFGGGPGARASAVLNPGTPEESALPSKFIRRFARGEAFRAEMAGAGGYGDPAERDPASIAEDLRQGKITPSHAAEAYGYVAGSPDAAGPPQSEVAREIRTGG